jgi:natural product precursor
MKRKKVGKKLSLTKETIASLNTREMKGLDGGHTLFSDTSTCTCTQIITCSAGLCGSEDYCPDTYTEGAVC